MSTTAEDLAVLVCATLESDFKFQVQLKEATRESVLWTWGSLLEGAETGTAWAQKYDYEGSEDLPFKRDEWLGDQICIMVGEILAYGPMDTPQASLWRTFMGTVSWATVGKYFRTRYEEDA